MIAWPQYGIAECKECQHRDPGYGGHLRGIAQEPRLKWPGGSGVSDGEQRKRNQTRCVKPICRPVDKTA